MNAIQAGIGVNTVVVRNPATDKVIGEIACLSAPEINAAVARAAAAQPRWGATPVSQRLQVLRKFQRLLAQQKDAVASVITREAGKPKVEALSTEILVVLDAVNFLLANVAAFLRPEAVPHANPVMKLKRGWLRATDPLADNRCIWALPLDHENTQRHVEPPGQSSSNPRARVLRQPRRRPSSGKRGACRRG